MEKQDEKERKAEETQHTNSHIIYTSTGHKK
jgi:hypothetical protein